MMYGSWFGAHSFMWIFNMFIWLAIIIFVVYILIKIPGTMLSNNKDNAEEILKIRYAKGEISSEEFEKMMGEIKK